MSLGLICLHLAPGHANTTSGAAEALGPFEAGCLMFALRWRWGAAGWQVLLTLNYFKNLFT